MSLHVKGGILGTDYASAGDGYSATVQVERKISLDELMRLRTGLIRGQQRERLASRGPVRFGWHFLPENRVPTNWHNDDPVEVGDELIEYREQYICHVGLHGSARAVDALKYAPGPVACWCRFRGVGEARLDKFVATRRKVLAMADAWQVLELFSQMVHALGCADLGRFHKFADARSCARFVANEMSAMVMWGNPVGRSAERLERIRASGDLLECELRALLSLKDGDR